MKRYALFVAFGFALYDCNFLGSDLGCQSTIIDNQQLDFESACTGANCTLTTLGSTEMVPSLLPGDHALALDAAASATWTLGIAGNGEGTSLAMSFRCDEGGSLLLGVQGTGGVSMNVGATADWQRRVWPLNGTPTSFGTMADATAGRHEAVVGVSNSGRARCVIDWLRFVAAPRVCRNSRACSSLSQTFCNGACADLNRDPRNCGACGQVCGASQSCERGVCRPIDCGFCPRGTYCSAEGVCTSSDAGFYDVPDVQPRDTGVRPDVGVPSRTAVVAGRRCTNDEACVTDAADLVCTELPGGRICSGVRFCEQGTIAQEEAQCGGRFSTCLAVGRRADGTQASACTRACVATAGSEETGACPSGSVCTTTSLLLDPMQTESPGCLPFCERDSDCTGIAAGDASLMRCNTRTGRCANEPHDPRLRADGLPCDPQEIVRTTVSQCRGTCFALNAARPTEGICGSLINVGSGTGACPDGADMRPRTVSGDNLGLCIVRDCERNDQCAPGLVCVHPEDSATGVRVDLPRTCSYPTAPQPGGATGDAGVRADVAMD